MEHTQLEHDARMNELLRRMGEFVAYFELSETHLIGWREEIERRNARIEEQTQRIECQLNSIMELLSQTGISRFRIIAEHALAQGEVHVQTLEQQCTQLTQHLDAQKEQMKQVSHEFITQIEQQGNKAVAAIANQLAQYDAHHFHRIANESCDSVERAAQDAVQKSNKILRMFQMRLGFMGVVTTFITTFLIALYLSGELPWEMHHKALNERHAGKVLLQAWPNLTFEEKTKILNDDGLKHGG